MDAACPSLGSHLPVSLGAFRKKRLNSVLPLVLTLKPTLLHLVTPDLTIANNLDEAIHVAFFITAPTNWKNNLQPGKRWTTHLPTLPLYFQARWAERTDHDSGIITRSREFSPQESWEMGATIGAACAAGTASVAIGMTSALTGWGGPLAGTLMTAANAGGAKYATMGSNTMLCETRVWVPWFEHKVYSVRMVGAGRRGLWDVKENKQA